MAFLTAAEALRWALEIEKNGETFYHAVAAKSADPEVKALFEDLAAQERGHYQVFQKMLEEVKPEPDLSNVDYDEYQAYLQVALDSALFAGPDKGLTLAKQALRRGSGQAQNGETLEAVRKELAARGPSTGPSTRLRTGPSAGLRTGPSAGLRTGSGSGDGPASGNGL